MMGPCNIRERLLKLGLQMQYTKTGHKDWARGFVLDPEGCSIGRAVFFKGEFSHIKWYWRGYGPIIKADYYISAWYYVLTSGEVLSQRVYDVAVEWAKVARKKKIEEIREWRRKNPSYKRDGTKKCRRRIEGPSLRRLTNEYLAEAMQ